MRKAIFLSDTKYVNRNLREARRDVSHRSTVDPALPNVQSIPQPLSTRKRRPRREIDQSSSSSAEISNDKICTSTPPYAFTEWTGTTLTFWHRNFTFKF
jgi:hypothetical protein